ncbi:zinc finger CCHC domain-containing protein 7 [Solea solea]|uniref:zinc finger CCHC domain-containing protein 7 n=1 Tax=Solea solea TaxID=90069 RepID=UPI00272B052C|nr:zinc finger CCHC domain-containing protein 7 [Solea solea]
MGAHGTLYALRTEWNSMEQSNLKKKSSLSVPVTVDISSSDSDSDESESKSESDSSDSLDSSDSSDSEGLENWMILGQGKQNEDQSISLNLEGGSDSNTDAEEEDGSWLVSDKDKEAQICNKDKGARTVLQRVSNRYYTSKNVNCRNCNKTGHLSKNCPEPKKLSPCFLCGTPGHQTRDCPNRHCNNCGLPGHLYSSCSERAYWHKQCHRCGMKGHFFDVCPEIWRQYHITGKTGPPVMQQGEDNGRSPAFCYNCSRKGHFGHACTRQRMFNGVYATIPFISHYDTVEDINRRQHRLKMKVKELKRNGCFSNTCENPVTPEPPKKKQKLNHHKNNHTHHQTSQNHKPSRSHIYFNNDDDDDLTIPKTNKFSKCKQQQSTSNVKPWKPKRPVPTSRDPSTKLFLDEADDFPRGRGKGRGIVGKKSNKNKMKTKEEPKGGQRDRRPDHLFGEKRKKNQARRVSNKKSAASMYPTDENLFIIKQRKRR